MSLRIVVDVCVKDVCQVGLQEEEREREMETSGTSNKPPPLNQFPDDVPEPSKHLERSGDEGQEEVTESWHNQLC